MADELRATKCEYIRYKLDSYCVGGYYDIAKTIIETYKLSKHIQFGLLGSCKGGHIDIVNLMIKNGACLGGNLEMINIMIERGANNWDLGVIGAISQGDIEIIKLMIDNGTTNLDDNLQWRLLSAKKEIELMENY